MGPVKKYFSAFQLSYENKTCSECQHDVRKTEKHAERQTDRKTERLFSLGVKTKVVHFTSLVWHRSSHLSLTSQPMGNDGANKV